MRPTTIPDEQVAAHPGSIKGVIAGPPGVSPVEALFDGLVDGGFERAMVRCELEPGDLEKLAAGGHVWLIFAGPIPVFGLTVTPPTE
ncbi:hypothetical protein ABZ793_06145 [Micromonospora sp. NPDC047465]|uniref:hypothetical protein n=1 Tax=Micromonospora sp. NPDC047465 TaxID=3154813 RepID=UPI0033D7886E